MGDAEVLLLHLNSGRGQASNTTDPASCFGSPGTSLAFHLRRRFSQQQSCILHSDTFLQYCDVDNSNQLKSPAVLLGFATLCSSANASARPDASQASDAASVTMEPVDGCFGLHYEDALIFSK